MSNQTNDAESDTIANSSDRTNYMSSFTFQDIAFTTAKGKTIISGLSGMLSQGQLLAILGSSGSGKSTLLNILARRAESTTGTVLVDGFPITTSQLRNISCYVEQQDNLIGSLTVFETVIFAAKLAMPGFSHQDRLTRVNEIISAFGLHEQRNVKVGTPLQRGLSGGQKRRLSIASMLVTLPKVVFLDEPTSGLDSSASHQVMSCIKKLALENNMLVLTSIHQPSSATFQLFDKCLLLSRGKQLYFGNASEVPAYFDTTAFPIASNINPADHMLDISNIDFYQDRELGEQRVQTLHDSWLQSSAFKVLENALQLNSTMDISEKTMSATRDDADRPQIGLLKQALVISHRSFIKAIRDPLAYGVRLAMYLGLAILMGTVWLRLTPTQGNIQAYTNAIFFGGAFMSFMAVAYIPSFLEDYSNFQLEHRNGMSRPVSFLIANMIVGVPFLFLIALLFSVITYFMIHFAPSASGFFMYVLWLFLDLLAAESLVVLISIVFPNFVIALTLIAFANGLWMCVNGFLVPQDTLNVFWRYTFHQIDYQRYTFEAMMNNEFLKRLYHCDTLSDGSCSCLYSSPLEDQCLISGSVILQNYSVAEIHMWKWVIITLSIIAFMRLAVIPVMIYRR
jgi:ABC-type multidrug transport system ATPase subunit